MTGTVTPFSARNTRTGAGSAPGRRRKASSRRPLRANPNHGERGRVNRPSFQRGAERPAIAGWIPSRKEKARLSPRQESRGSGGNIAFVRRSALAGCALAHMRGGHPGLRRRALCGWRSMHRWRWLRRQTLEDLQNRREKIRGVDAERSRERHERHNGNVGLPLLVGLDGRGGCPERPCQLVDRQPADYATQADASADVLVNK